MKKHFLIVWAMLWMSAHNTSAQIFSPNIFQVQKSEPAAGVISPGNNENPYLLVQLNGAFRETTNLSADNSDKINGSLIATLFKEGKYSFTIGYTLNKIRENVTDSRDSYFNSVLIPDFGGQSFTFESNFFPSLKSKFGLYANLGVGLDKWTIDKNSYNSSPIQLKLMAAYFPLKDFQLNPDNKFTFVIRGGISGRLLTSDLSLEEELLNDKFGTSKTSYWGLEFNANLIFSDLNLYFSPAWFFGTKDIDRFPSNGIYTLGVILTGDFLKFELQQKSK